MTYLSPRIKNKPQTFLTVIPTRTPRDKLHATRGLATSAIKYSRREAALYEMRDGEWVLLCTVVVKREKSAYGDYSTTRAELIWEEGEEQ